MYISYLKLNNWKNYRSTEAELTRRVFLIGPNASGKSNLLDALRFLRDLAQIGLGRAVQARGGVSPLRCLAARESSSISVAVRLSDDDGVDKWLYEIEFTQGSTLVPRVKKEVVRDLTKNEDITTRPDPEDEADPLRLTQTSLEQIIANKDFREIPEFFNSISYQHLVPQVVRDPKGFSAAFVQDDPFGRDLLLRIWKTNAIQRSAWLSRIGKVLGQAVPQLVSLNIELDKEGTPHLVGRYEHWRAHAARQNEAQFSDGTLRLFGLMWSMFEGMGPLLLEEPELSLHPEVVRNLPQMLVRLQEEIRKMRKKPGYESRQVFLSTHSEEMLQDGGIGPDEVIRIEPSPEGSRMIQPNSEERAMMAKGLSAAEVILPKSSPGGTQLLFKF